MPQKYSAIERRIMRLLYQAKAPLTAFEIAKMIGVSFPTAQKYLKKLTEKKILILDEENETYR